MSVFQSAIDLQFGQLLALAGTVVTYRRGPQWSAVRMVPGGSEHDAAADDGTITRVKRKDWICRASDLVIGGVPILPERGDRIEETAGTRVYTYEVLPPSEGQEVYESPDPERKRYRIHTQLVQVA
jgi:hypothetical protein